MSTELKWTDNLVAEFIQTKLHIVDSASFELIEGFKESKQPKPIFTTEEGRPISIDDEYWYVTKDYDIFNAVCNSMTGAKIVSGMKAGDKYFATEKAAKEWILFNKPLLSLNEIKQLGQIQNPEDNIYFKKLIEAAKINLNK